MTRQTDHPQRVLIIAGGLTHERDVSVRSGRRVASTLHHLGHKVCVCDLDSELLTGIKDFQPDVIWPLIHGSLGEDGSLQGLLENLDIPFVGSNSAQAMMATNKPTAKSLVGSSGLNTPGWVTLPQQLFRQVGASGVLDSLDQTMHYPAIVKPADGGSALGLSKVTSAEELRLALVDAFAYGERVMIENFVEGTEVAVSVLDLENGPTALPPIEIVTDDGRYDYDARYTTDSTEYFVPARLDQEVLDHAQETAWEIHALLGLRHLSRIDVIVDPAGTVWFIDANVAPGMTDTSLFPQAADAQDSFSAVCDRIVHFVASDL